MNRNDFLEILEHRIPEDNSMLGELSELINIFPYFQSAHMLLLKGLTRNEDVRFSNQLRNSAVFIADREVLYNYLREPVKEISVATQAEPALATQKETDISDNQQPAVVREASVEIPALQDLTEPEYAEPVQTGNIMPVNQESAEAVNISIEQEIATEQTVIESARNSEEIIAGLEKDVPASEDETVEEDTEDEALPDIIAQEDDREEVNDSIEMSVTGDVDDELLELEPENYSDTYNINVPLRDNDARFTEIKDAGILSQADLIDRFIIANPRIEPIRDKKDIPTEDRSAPLYDESGFVTETLAKIYVSQGYYSRAIDIFERLTLKFPEKSSYFAAQIEKVKEYLKK